MDKKGLRTGSLLPLRTGWSEGSKLIDICFIPVNYFFLKLHNNFQLYTNGYVEREELRTSHMGITLELVTNADIRLQFRPHEKELHFNEIPKQFTGTLMFKKCYLRAPPLSLQY